MGFHFRSKETVYEGIRINFHGDQRFMFKHNLKILFMEYYNAIRRFVFKLNVLTYYMYKKIRLDNPSCFYGFQCPMV